MTNHKICKDGMLYVYIVQNLCCIEFEILSSQENTGKSSQANQARFQ